MDFHNLNKDNTIHNSHRNFLNYIKYFNIHQILSNYLDFQLEQNVWIFISILLFSFFFRFLQELIRSRVSLFTNLDSSSSFTNLDLSSFSDLDSSSFSNLDSSSSFANLDSLSSFTGFSSSSSSFINSFEFISCYALLIIIDFSCNLFKHFLF